MPLAELYLEVTSAVRKPGAVLLSQILRQDIQASVPMHALDEKLPFLLRDCWLKEWRAVHSFSFGGARGAILEVDMAAECWC